MAKATKPKATATPAAAVIQNLPLNKIVASKHNPRKTFDKAYIKELAESMSGSSGLLSPITVRPNKNDGYEIVVGECRYRAATSLQWETIPCMVKDISDEDLLEVMIIENLNRENINPLEEATAFKTLLQKETLEWLSAKIHKPKKYITDRLKLNDLIPEAKKYVQKGVLPLGHAIAIAKLSFADQQACLTKCINDSDYGEHTENAYCDMALEQLKDFISDDIMLEFEKVNFDTNDATLYPKAGACSTCPKRTCNNNLLFNDITKDDKCTDAACFNEKNNLHIERQKELLKQEYGKVLMGDKGDYLSGGEIKVQGFTVKYSDTPVKNGLPVVINKTNRFGKDYLGKTVFVDAKKLESLKKEKEEKKAGKTKAVGNNYNSNLSWEERQIQDLQTNWYRIEWITQNIKSNAVITKDFLRDKLDSIDTLALIALASILKIIPNVNNAKEAFEHDDVFGFDAKKKVMDTLIDRYNEEELITLICLLKQWDDDGDDVKEDDEYGYKWTDLVNLISPAEELSKKAKSKR